MTPIAVRAGDVFVTRSNTLLGRLIRWGETDKSDVEAPWANHMGVVVGDGWIGGNPDAGGTGAAWVEATIVEALWKTRRGPLDTSEIDVRVFRPVPDWEPAELEAFLATADTFVGDTYGWWKLFFQLGDRMLFAGKKVLTTLLVKDDRPICSYLAAKVVAAAESRRRVMARFAQTGTVYAFGIPPQSVDPDSALEYMEQVPEFWKEIR